MVRSPIQSRQRRMPWGFAIGLLLIAAALAIGPFDVSVALTIRTEKLPGDIRRFLDLSEFWGHGLGALLVSVTVWLIVPSHRRKLYCVLGGYALAGITTNCVKLFCWRWRPGYYWMQDSLGAATWLDAQAISVQRSLTSAADPTNSLDGASQASHAWNYFFANLNWEHMTQSFPSGHSAAAAALAYGMTRLAPRGAAIYWLLACAACAQRISFNSHWPSDVFVGAAIGLFASAGVFELYERQRALYAPAHHSMPNLKIDAPQKLMTIDAA